MKKEQPKTIKTETRGRKFKGYTILYKKIPPELKEELTVYVDQKVKEFEDAKKLINSSH